MYATLKRRMNESHEQTIIMDFVETHGWDYEDGGLMEYLCTYYEDYEEYREWYLMMAA